MYLVRRVCHIHKALRVWLVEKYAKLILKILPLYHAYVRKGTKSSPALLDCKEQKAAWVRAYRNEAIYM